MRIRLWQAPLLMLIWVSFVSAHAQSAHPQPDACGSTDLETCRELGRSAEYARDFVGAVRHYRWACGEGDAVACTDIVHVADALSRDSLQWLFADAAAACGQADTNACWEAGVYATHSWWIGGGPVGAAAEWTELCAEGHAPSCHSLALAIEYSSVLAEQRASRAAELIGASCDGGWIAACHHLDAVAYAETFSDMQRGPIIDAMAESCDAGYRAACLDRWSLLMRSDVARGPSALQRLREECAQGEARACVRVASVDRDTDPAAVAVLEDVCATGFMSGCIALLDAQRGAVSPTSLDAESDMLAMACAAGHGSSCSQRIALYDDPRRASYDLDVATTVAHEGCDAGDVPSCFRWVRLLEPSERSVEFEEAEELLSALLTTRHPDAALELAHFYESRGLDVPNEALMEFVLDDACAAGSVEACAERGLELAADGRTVDAISPLAVGCNGEDVEACTTLAEILMDLGMAADGVATLEQACALGERQACESLDSFFSYTQPLRLDDASVTDIVEPLFGAWSMNVASSTAANPELAPSFFEDKRVVFEFEAEGRVRMVVEDGPQPFESVGVYRPFTLASERAEWAAVVMVFLDSMGGRFELQYAFGFDGAAIGDGQLGLIPTQPGIGIVAVPIVLDRAE